MSDAVTTAEDRLLDSYRIPVKTRSLQLADPDLEIAVRDTGNGKPVIFVHGSGMSGATWAPLLAHLPDRHAPDLPGPRRPKQKARRGFL